jgi:ring-1,2-phenylacetyl-CoA epoxidase subunit PaaE
MSTSFYKVKIKDITKETHDTVSISFDIPEDLKSVFYFRQGQYLTFKVPGHEDERRSYSLCSSPIDQEWRVAVKLVPGGLFSVLANEQLKVGDELEVMAPLGNFYSDLDGGNNKQYVFFAAGSGITPVISIIKTVLLSEPKSECTLFYSNKTSSGIIFKEQLEALKNKNLGRFSLYYLLSRERMDIELFQGRINEEKCQQLLENFQHILQGDEFFLCGPFEMIESVKGTLLNKSVDKSKIHTELFTPPDQKKMAVGKNSVEKIVKKDKISHVAVNVDGVTTEFELSFHGRSVLEEAVSKGVDLPYSCKGGVCSTCRAKLVEGEVEMTVNYALEEEEIEDGYILTCQSHPRSENVRIDFDQ